MCLLRNLFVTFFLYILALIIFAILSVVGFAWTIVKMFYKAKFKDAVKGLSDYFFTLALSKNQSGAVAFKGLFNDALIKGKGLPFGDEDKQISEVLGWNERYFELTKIGKYLVKVLNKLDPKHCEKTLFNEVEKAKKKVELFNKLENDKRTSSESN
jgi:hypothetical protein